MFIFYVVGEKPYVTKYPEPGIFMTGSNEDFIDSALKGHSIGMPCDNVAKKVRDILLDLAFLTFHENSSYPEKDVKKFHDDLFDLDVYLQNGGSNV